MTIIQRVLVQRKGKDARYVCSPHPHGLYYICGKCLRGVLRPMMRERCAVCNAMVVEVLEADPCGVPRYGPWSAPSMLATT